MRIAVYGAAGFQAGLVLSELSRRGIDRVLVGRNLARLPTEFGGERYLATIDDHAALAASFAGCDAVINCAGPFTGTGRKVIRAAIDAGCHYVDTAGEQHYVATVFDTFADDASRAGVTVVPATNDGCLPTDLAAHLLADRVGDDIDELVVCHVITGGGGASRGTLRTAQANLSAFRGDPNPARHPSITLPGQSKPIAVTRLPLCEVITIPRHVAVRHVESVVEAKLAAALTTPLDAATIDRHPVGPAPEARAGQRFTYVVDAVDRGRAAVTGQDTYGTTAVIAVEAARRLAEDGAQPGVLAAAQAFDPAEFLAFLAAQAGLGWTIRNP